MLKAVWDMETGDPDDFMTLLMLLDHPKVDLQAVTVTPGTPEQIGLVRRALEWFEKDIPVGAFNIEHDKKCVSSWHYRAYGNIPPSTNAEYGPELLLRVCGEATTMITGGPLKNLGEAIRLGISAGRNLRLLHLVVQGGFAGEGVVPPEKQLEKFKGKVTCPTYNLNGAPLDALEVINHPGIGHTKFVSKNVCHGVFYDYEMHKKIEKAKDSKKSLQLIWKGMEANFKSRGESYAKKMHDPLAACCAINNRIGKWEGVEIFRRKGEWGSRLKMGTGCYIIVDYDHDLFVETLLEK